MSAPTALDRRTFLVGLGALGTGLMVGCTRRGDTESTPSSPAPGAAADLTAWVHVGTDDTITFHVPESEMGQGVHTAVAMVLADEIGVPMDRVRAEHAPLDPVAFGRQGTGGSTSIRRGMDTFRAAGAVARELLIAAAAARWGVPASQCTLADGVISHPASARTLRPSQVATEAAALPPPSEPTLRQQRTVVGTRAARLDLPSKVTGAAVYGLDVQLDGMKTALLVHPPVFGATVATVDDTAALAVAGVVGVHRFDDAVAVVADHFWAAKTGRDALVVTWDEGPAASLSDDSIARLLAERVDSGAEARVEGDVTSALAGAAQTLRATYDLPYLAHAAMEPLNATAKVSADSVELWVSTQSPSSTAKEAAETADVPLENVLVHTTMLGGGFGRRSQTDFVRNAVRVAKAAGSPVKVVYTRQDDMRAGFYRPISHNTLVGGLDADGWPIAWEHRIAMPSIAARKGWLKGLIDGTSVEGAANLPYAVPNLRVTCANVELPVPIWYWRSVGSSIHAWVTECFLDELARLGGKDPVEVRRRLLVDKPRHLRVLNAAAKLAGWGTAPPEGRARGVAVHECFGSFVAQVAEVSLEGSSPENAVPRVHKVWCAVDCGDVVNPDTVEAQIEGSIVYGLTAALYGDITFQDGRVVQSNFHDQPLLRIDQMPVVQTRIVTSGDPWGGIGEPGTPPIAPAVCNALLALTGEPVRRLPIVG